jgi:MbtH protein
MENLTVFSVVVNHEQQYSIWPVGRAVPLGWTEAGKTGTKAECLAFINDVWKDMVPFSLRQEMESARRAQQAGSRSLEASNVA